MRHRGAHCQDVLDGWHHFETMQTSHTHEPPHGMLNLHMFIRLLASVLLRWTVPGLLTFSLVAAACRLHSQAASKLDADNRLHLQPQRYKKTYALRSFQWQCSQEMAVWLLPELLLREAETQKQDKLPQARTQTKVQSLFLPEMNGRAFCMPLGKGCDELLCLAMLTSSLPPTAWLGFDYPRSFFRRRHALSVKGVSLAAALISTVLIYVVFVFLDAFWREQGTST